MKARYAEIAEWFQALSPETLETVGEIYASDAVFIDPFNQLAGLSAVRAVYQHMFDTLDEPRFLVTQTVTEGHQAFMTWDFVFKTRGQLMKINGCTQFELDSNGLVVLHRDYWDTAHQLYEKIPLLGGVLRMLRRKLALPNQNKQTK